VKRKLADFKPLALAASQYTRNAQRALFRVLWFDYAIGEKNPLSGFVCEDHKASKRVEKLAIPK
jgi:hypothetical protein